MPKLSISIPDDLWDEAKSLADEGTPSSQVVQAALGEWVAQRRRGGALQEFEPDKRRLLEIAATLGSSYELEFRRGYDDGLRIAEWVGFDAVSEYIRNRDWQMVLEMAPSKEHVREDGSVEWRVHAPVVDELGFDDAFWEWVGVDADEGVPAREVYADGADRAFRDLWDALRGGEWRSAEPSESAGDER
jgi:hypothetical protein